MKLTGAQIVVKMLEKQGIKTVSGIPGGSILPLYDELNKSSIRHILVRQEQAAGFIAQGMARTSGKAAVCLATSGPGAMNDSSGCHNRSGKHISYRNRCVSRSRHFRTFVSNHKTFNRSKKSRRTFNGNSTGLCNCPGRPSGSCFN